MIRLRFLLGICFFLMLGPALGQVTTDPAFPVAGEAVKIIFDATQGTAGLQDYTGDIYAHTGVITDQSTSGSDWKYVIADWNVNTDKAKLTRVSTNIYELEITPDITSFYGVPSSEKTEQLAFVFRSFDGSLEGKASGGADIFVDVYEAGLAIEITDPADNSVLQKNQPVNISASSSVDADLKLYSNETLIAQNTGNTISASYTFTESGSNWLIAEASSAGETLRDSISVFIREDVITETKPANYKKGINYIDDNTAALVLWAPLKEFVYVTGDFNNWQLSDAYLMKKDGDYFWLELTDLEAGKEYAYQYLIDGNIRIADPYTEKILDPWNDSYINEATYPNLKAYPEGLTEGIVSVLQTTQPEYNWQVTDFVMPEKEKLVIYELLVRDFTTGHTYQGVIDQLDYLADLRINVLELMPVNEFEGNSSWGYNPSFYFAPDKYYGPKEKLKELVDECHQRGIAVVIDMVLNHSYGQSPFVQMYWNNSGKPDTDNPWYNEESNFQNPDAQWGYDFNHESTATRQLVDSISSFWMTEYKVDGFRFDFTKGFSNTPYAPSSWGSEYDADRIANLKRMSDEIWKRNPGALVIFEHLADNSEETELANHGIMLWGNLNYSYGETAMGYNDNLNWGIYSNRGWDEPNLVTYMESHDEERLTYKCLAYGKSAGAYNTQDLTTALDRMELNSVFFIPLPGPKMIWQFGERGYDQSINRCTDGTINNDCRLSEKPPFWNYLENTDRTDLFQVMAKLNELKQKYDVFSPDNAEYSMAGITKWYKLSKGDNHVVGLGNFDVVENDIVLTFPTAGKYYEFFSGDSIEVTSSSQTFTFDPGEYRLYSTQQFEEPSIVTDIDEIENTADNLQIYPNPVSGKLTVSSDKTISTIQLFSVAGTMQFETSDVSENKVEINVQDYTPGVYLIRVIQDGDSSTQKVLVK
nr:alpha-amylase family glycosyl hydrolase [uncultured Draconibacterium sp.]